MILGIPGQKSHEEAASYLGEPLADLAPTLGYPLTEEPGTVISPYKLLQQIGEGGMGVVYMVEQSEPVKPGLILKGRKDMSVF